MSGSNPLLVTSHQKIFPLTLTLSLRERGKGKNPLAPSGGEGRVRGWGLWLLVTGCWLLCSSSLLAADDKEVTLPRTEDGYVVNKDTYLNIADDRKVKQVAMNVIRPESVNDYLKRRMLDLENKVAALDERLKTLESKK